MAPFRLLWPCSVPLKVLLRKIGRGWKRGLGWFACLLRRVLCRRKRQKTATTKTKTNAEADETGLSAPVSRDSPSSALYHDDDDEDVPRVSLRAGREVGGTFFQVAAVALAYGAVAPLALPFAALWCLLSWIVWRLQILYVFERSYEGGGALFYTGAGGVAAALGAHAFFTGCVLAANGAVALGGPLAAGGPLGVWLFHRRCGRRYGGMAAAGAPALLTASVGSVVAGGGGGGGSGGRGGGGGGENAFSSSSSSFFAPPEPPEALRDVWTPPALRKDARGWRPGEGAVWQGWKAPAFFPSS